MCALNTVSGPLAWGSSCPVSVNVSGDGTKQPEEFSETSFYSDKPGLLAALEKGIPG